MTQTTLLLLAAGQSSRMRGRDKLLEDIDGQPLLRLMAARALKAGVPVRVVLGPDQTARRAALEGLALELIETTDSDGMAASIRAGVAGLRGPVLIVLADMPEIMARDLYLMVTLQGQDPRMILRAAAEDGQPGHPVLFPADLLPDLAKLSGDEGAKAILTREAARVILFPLEGQRALVDLDTPEAWDDWRASRSQA
jgi:CTP:molybdopterin cytidylyltransferase MocA